MSYISSRLAAVKPSASMAVPQAARTLRAKGVATGEAVLSEAIARVHAAIAQVE